MLGKEHLSGKYVSDKNDKQCMFLSVGADPGFLPGEGAPRDVRNWTYTEMGIVVEDIRKHSFAALQNICCYTLLEWC